MNLIEQAAVNGGKAYMENRRPDGYPSSPVYDASLIYQHVLYWCGRAPKQISTGRGHSYNVFIGPNKYQVRITDYKDHRNGVVGLRGAV